MTSGPPWRSIAAAFTRPPLSGPPDLPVLDRHHGGQTLRPRHVLAVRILEVEAPALEIEDGDVGDGAGLERPDLSGAPDHFRRRGGGRPDHTLEGQTPAEELPERRRPVPLPPPPPRGTG